MDEEKKTDTNFEEIDKMVKNVIAPDNESDEYVSRKYKTNILSQVLVFVFALINLIVGKVDPTVAMIVVVSASVIIGSVYMVCNVWQKKIDNQK